MLAVLTESCVAIAYFHPNGLSALHTPRQSNSACPTQQPGPVSRHHVAGDKNSIELFTCCQSFRQGVGCKVRGKFLCSL